VESGRSRKLGRWQQQVLPAWLTVPLAALGIAFVVLYPFGISSTWGYVTALVIAAAIGLWTHWRYEVKVLERSDHRVVYSFGHRRPPTNIDE
jgi:hypothetical protein